ncbi:MAG: hypothetical protein BroJett018_50730 [Chloroflexota bacterium]|nr:MAG: hypothetical protein BroJett018_50730 [Chloroflexota bacterium]
MFLAMHISDGFLNLPVSLAGWVLTIVVVGLALRRMGQTMDERQAPLMGVLAAFVFAAQMINFPVAGGTSGHLIGGMLVAALIGPWAAVIVMTCVVGVQALIFQDGGLVVMGFNIFNMGILAPFVGYAVYRGFTSPPGGLSDTRLWVMLRKPHGDRFLSTDATCCVPTKPMFRLTQSRLLMQFRSISDKPSGPLSADSKGEFVGDGTGPSQKRAHTGYAHTKFARSGLFLGAWASVEIGALATALEIAASGTSDFEIAVPAMLGIHALIGIGEALITVAAVGFIRQARPDLVQQARSARRPGWMAAGLVLALMVVVFSPLASSHPDGLERVAEDHDFLDAAEGPIVEILPDYTIPVIHNEALTTILAGALGVLIVAGIGYVVTRVNRRAA